MNDERGFRRGHVRGPLIVGVFGVVVAVVLTMVLASLTSSAHILTGNESDLEPGVGAASAKLLQLDPLGRASYQAPAVALTDQDGHPMTLHEYRGTSVVLTFNDDMCTDLCTLLAQDVVAADRDLGSARKRVSFVSVNANPYFPSSQSVSAWDTAHGLEHLSNWHYGTGAPSVLAQLAKAYGVPIELDATNRTVVHGTEIFFIGPSGRVRALGQFGTESADTPLFAHVMAQSAVDLLPADQRTTVAGPSAQKPSAGGSSIGSTAPAVRLAALGVPGSVSVPRGGSGHMTVLDFWSSSCTGCAEELPSLQRESSHLGGSVRFVGIDVSDQSAAARSMLARTGVTYPNGWDPTGATAARFQVTGLPYLVVLNGRGKVVIRHPGVMTQEQLDYVLNTLESSG